MLALGNADIKNQGTIRRTNTVPLDVRLAGTVFRGQRQQSEPSKRESGLRYRDKPPSHGLALGQNNTPMMRVTSSTESTPALISDARTGRSCGGHKPGRLAAQAQPGSNGWVIQSTSKPKKTTEAAITGERVAPCILMDISPDYRSGTPPCTKIVTESSKKQYVPGLNRCMHRKHSLAMPWHMPREQFRRPFPCGQHHLPCCGSCFERSSQPEMYRLAGRL